MTTGVEIPASTLWAAAAAAIAWVFRIERWRGRMLTRAEHEAICQQRQKEIAERLSAIQRTLESQDDRSSAHRASVSRQLTGISVKIAVLQTRAGNPPTGDTGTHPRL